MRVCKDVSTCKDVRMSMRVHIIGACLRMCMMVVGRSLTTCIVHLCASYVDVHEVRNILHPQVCNQDNP